MKIKKLVRLVSEAADGKDNIQRGAIGSNGYGFVFIDDKDSNIPYVFYYASSKLCGAGSYTKWFFKLKDAEFDIGYDLLLAGSLKTLVPSLQFGGDEMLFRVWLFVKTSDGKMFPATFYYGPSGTSIGAWELDDIEWFTNKSPEELFSKKFLSVINFWPFNFSDDELRCLIEALELALWSVPVSDFYGIYTHDFGNSLMGVAAGNPFTNEFGFTYNNDDVKKSLYFLEYNMDNYENIKNQTNFESDTSDTSLFGDDTDVELHDDNNDDDELETLDFNDPIISPNLKIQELERLKKKLKKKICSNCQKDIEFSKLDYILRFSDIELEYVIKSWSNPDSTMFCDDCYTNLL